jgi:hypothetical protein
MYWGNITIDTTKNYMLVTNQRRRAFPYPAAAGCSLVSLPGVIVYPPGYPGNPTCASKENLCELME